MPANFGFGTLAAVNSGSNQAKGADACGGLPRFAAADKTTPQGWVRSSAEEHYLDMVGVTGSIPVAPTTLIIRLAAILGRGEPAFVLSCVLRRHQRRDPQDQTAGDMLNSTLHDRDPGKRQGHAPGLTL